MAKSIKNYTSGISAASSMSSIEEKLVAVGARDIHKSYNNKRECDAITFIMAVPDHPMPIHFKLPAKVDACYEALWRLHVKSVKTKPLETTKQTIREQALRTAWKIIHDWVDIQITLIELQQAEAMEIFLPYAYNSESKETFYEHMKKSKFIQLPNA